MPPVAGTGASGVRVMTSTQAWILVVAVCVVALAALVDLLRK